MKHALVLDGPHRPTGDDDCANQAGEAEGAETQHQLRLGALSDAEDNRDEERAEQSRAEVGEHVQEAFLPLAREWASTAATRLSRPPRMRNFVP